MAGKMVQFPSNGPTTDGYLATPAGGKGPGVVVIQEWWGLVGHIKAVCDRFAVPVHLQHHALRRQQHPGPRHSIRLPLTYDTRVTDSKPRSRTASHELAWGLWGC